MTDIEVQESYTDHDGGEFSAVNVRVVATWPAPTFVENLAIDSAGAIFVSLYSHNRVERYYPATGATAPFADLPAPPMGLAFDAGGSLWATGGTFRKGHGYIWKIGRDGSVQHWTDLPDAVFMNGCTLHPNGHTLLACESLTGRILAIDLREPGRWWAWLTDERLKPNHPQFPGANGIKIRDGWAWISVSGRRLILRTPLQPDGRPGPIETAATHVLADDFAFGASGSLYIATHPQQTVFRLERLEPARHWRGLSRAPSAPRRARSGARLAMRTRSTSRLTAVWSRRTKAPFKRRSCSVLRLARWAGL